MEAITPVIQTVTKYAIPLGVGAYVAYMAEDTASVMLKKYKWPFVVVGGLGAVWVMNSMGYGDLTKFPK